MELLPFCVSWPQQTWVLARPGPFAWSAGVRSHLVHRAVVSLWVSTVVAFLIGGGAVGAEAETAASVPAGVHWRASTNCMPMWGPHRFWPRSGLVLRCLGPGCTVLTLDPRVRGLLVVVVVVAAAVAAAAAAAAAAAVMSSYPTPGPLMSTPLINTGQPTLYYCYYGECCGCAQHTPLVPN